MITAYERRIAKLEREKLLAAERLNQKQGPARTFEDMFELGIPLKPMEPLAKSDNGGKKNGAETGLF